MLVNIEAEIAQLKLMMIFFSFLLNQLEHMEEKKQELQSNSTLQRMGEYCGSNFVACLTGSSKCSHQLEEKPRHIEWNST